METGLHFFFVFYFLVAFLCSDRGEMSCAHIIVLWCIVQLNLDLQFTIVSSILFLLFLFFLFFYFILFFVGDSLRLSLYIFRTLKWLVDDGRPLIKCLWPLFAFLHFLLLSCYQTLSFSFVTQHWQGMWMMIPIAINITTEWCGQNRTLLLL